MKKRIAHRSLAFFGILGLFSSLSYGEPVIRIIQPYENSNIPPVSQSFVFGSVTPATATLTINGLPVKPYFNGGFLVMIPFSQGAFKIEAYASDGVSSMTVTRSVNVASPAQPFPADYKNIHPLSPRTRVVLRPGDPLEVSFQGAVGGMAMARFKEGGEPWPLEEQASPVGGIYKGVYVIRPEDKWDGSDLVFSLKRRDGKKITEKAGAQVTVQRRRTPRLIELKEDATLLTGPDSDFGYNMFCLKGTRLEVSGEQGDFLRVQVGGETNQGWIRKSVAIDLPAGAIPAKSISRNFRVSTTSVSTILEVPLQFRHAHRIEQFTDPHNLKLTLFGVVADSDRIRYKSEDSIIKEVNWHQREPQVLEIDIQTKQRTGWGYDVRYDGNTFVLEIRHRPPSGTKGAPLRGLKIALDAGHSKNSYGTIGPRGNTEADVVMANVRMIKAELEKKGAEVFLTQDGTKELSLQERVDLAWQARVNMFVSVHADACAEGQDPRELEGFSVHYYHPQSHELAEKFQKFYGAKSGVRNQGVWRSNLAVCRPTQYPSVLFELGFLILPEYEDMFVSPKHQKLTADVLTQAIIQYMKENPR